MTHRLATNYAKNYCNRTLIVKVIVENVVTCFFLGTRCSSRGYGSEYMAIHYYTGQPLLSETVRSLTVFGHLHCADPWQNHLRCLQAYISDPWRIGRPRQSWLRTVEADLRSMNLGLATVKRCVQDRSAWQEVAAMTTSSQTCF